MKFPIDFEAKVKVPPGPAGTGYPYRISARDLMDNFRFAAVEIPATTPSGNPNAITEVVSPSGRSISVDLSAISSGSSITEVTGTVGLGSAAAFTGSVTAGVLTLNLVLPYKIIRMCNGDGTSSDINVVVLP